MSLYPREKVDSSIEQTTLSKSYGLREANKWNYRPQTTYRESKTYTRTPYISRTKSYELYLIVVKTKEIQTISNECKVEKGSVVPPGNHKK